MKTRCAACDATDAVCNHCLCMGCAFCEARMTIEGLAICGNARQGGPSGVLRCRSCRRARKQAMSATNEPPPQVADVAANDAPPPPPPPATVSCMPVPAAAGAAEISNLFDRKPAALPSPTDATAPAAALPPVPEPEGNYTELVSL